MISHEIFGYNTSVIMNMMSFVHPMIFFGQTHIIIQIYSDLVWVVFVVINKSEDV